MANDVVLTAALRNNLLSLQNTQSLIDTAQFRLSTGRKVNSALDSPQSFFAAQALNDRASDLTRLLDNIGQSIQVIKAADNGVTALTKLVEQADSIAQAARDALAQGTSEAKITGASDLRGVEDLTALAGIGTGDTFTLQITDNEGNPVSIGTYGTSSPAAQVTITISANESIEDIINEINDIHFQVNGVGSAVGERAFDASLTDEGFLEIKTLDGNDFRVEFLATPAGDAANFALASELGFADVARLVRDGGAATNNVEVTAVADVALRSVALYESGATPTLATRSTLLSALRTESSATLLVQNIDATSDFYQIGINGGTLQNISVRNEVAGSTASGTIQDFLDRVNQNAALNTKIRADFDDDTGVITIEAIDASVQSVEIGVTSANTLQANFGFGRNNALSANNSTETETIRLAAAAGELAGFENDYNGILEQIDLLVEDTGYRGTNLLNGDNLETFFNEFRTSSLVTEGATFNSAGLGLSAANFTRESTVDGTLDDVRSALESVRSYASSLAADLSVIQTRQTFTNELINTLKAGSDALTVADSNEEGAKLLALQTRQQLGVTSLALASQSQQSILRLF